MKYHLFHAYADIADAEWSLDLPLSGIFMRPEGSVQKTSTLQSTVQRANSGAVCVGILWKLAATDVCIICTKKHTVWLMKCISC